MKILIRDCTILTLADPPVRRHVWLAISEGQIQEIAAEPFRGAEATFDQVLSGTDRLVLPGLINAHTHLAMVLMRGYADDLPLQRWLTEAIWPVEERLSDEDVYWASLLGLAEMIRSGTTCFADMYFHMDAVAQAVQESGLRANLARGLVAPEPDAEMEAKLADTERFIQKFNGAAQGRIQVSVAPHAIYTCCDQLWERAIRLSERYKILIHTHLCETRREVEESQQRWGESPIEHLDKLGLFRRPVLAAHCVHLREQDIEILAQHQVQVVHNPGSNLKIASGIAPLSRLLQAEINVALGTDGASSNNNLDLLEEMRLAALLQKGILAEATALPAPQALRLATVNGARALGLATELGSVEPGRRADLILMDTGGPHWIPDYNPVSNLVYAAHASDVRTVIVEGQLIMKEGNILTFDEEEVLARGRALQEKYAPDRGGRS
ncbi:MAG TPA: amidohydrolase [Candidatus Fraserbacteria bacterium]|nr:amidohydrolase [Candidatus Fraserbacteria bacterium]